MVIDSLLIEGISNIGSLRLGLGQLNALLAPNGYGKSNVLSAVEFGMKFLSAAPQDKLQMMRSRFTPLNIDMLGKDFCFEISGKFDGEEQDVQKRSSPESWSCFFNCLSHVQIDLSRLFM